MVVFTARQQMMRVRFGLMIALMLSGAAACVSAQNPTPPAPGVQPVGTPATGTLAANTRPPGPCEVPVSERTEEIGCYLTAIQPLGVLPEGPRFWHTYRYPSRPLAEQAKRPGDTVVESFGRVLLYAIDAENWRPTGGERLAVIGPLPHEHGKQYTARYMEAAFRPGMRAGAHRHSGAEAWYMLEGAQCVETPDGATTIRAGESAIVGAGLPMVLSQIGPETRRSVVLVLHESSEPWVTGVIDWTPQGLCPG